MSAFSLTRIPRTLLILSLLLPIGTSGQQPSIPKEPLRDSLEKIRWKAQTGDSYYQGYLGILHRTGYKDVQLSKVKARHWSSLSAKKKNL